MRSATWNAAAVGLALVITSCGDDDSDGANGGGAHEQDASQQHIGSPNSAMNDLVIAFGPMYSAYVDDDHPCVVPAIVLGKDTGLRWQASDDSMVDLVPDADGGVLIRTKKAGTVDIIARTDSQAGHSTLTITPFTLAEWQAGERRYHSDVEYVPPTMAEVMAAVRRHMDEDAGDDELTRSLRPPAGTGCVGCHGDGAATLAVENTPQQAGGYSDTELAEMIKTGKRPPTGLSEPTPAFVLELLHADAANLDATEARNIVAYMRSIPPKAIGPIDFGGFGAAK